jgi:hypothetical protein
MIKPELLLLAHLDLGGRTQGRALTIRLVLGFCDPELQKRIVAGW